VNAFILQSDCNGEDYSDMLEIRPFIKQLIEEQAIIDEQEQNLPQ